MNRYERIPLAAGEAELRYLDGDYRIVRPGSYVLRGHRRADLARRAQVLERRVAGRPSAHPTGGDRSPAPDRRKALISEGSRGASARRFSIAAGSMNSSVTGSAFVAAASSARAGVAPHAHEILSVVTRTIVRARMRQQGARVIWQSAVMVGKAAPFHDFGTDCDKRRKKFLRPADAGECQNTLLASASAAAASGTRRALNTGIALEVAASATSLAAPRPIKMSPWARATCAVSGARQGAGGKHRPFPMPVSASITRSEKSFLSEGFCAVVDHDHARAQLGRELHAGDAICGDDCWGMSDQQQRFVADLPESMPGSTRIGLRRLPAIAAADDERLLAQAIQHFLKRDHDLSLAAAADGGIADTDDGNFRRVRRGARAASPRLRRRAQPSARAGRTPVPASSTKKQARGASSPIPLQFCSLSPIR